MTEQEWLSSSDPQTMLAPLIDYRQGRLVQAPFAAVSDRKLRLFACACWRGFPWTPHPLLPLELGIVAQAEAYADDDERLLPLRAQWAGTTVLVSDSAEYAARKWSGASLYAARQRSRASLDVEEAMLSARAALLRDIVGNPFRPSPELRRVVCSPRDMSAAALEAGASEEVIWQAPCLTPTVLSLSEAAYEERLPDGTLDATRLMVLADAMEDAGCDSEEVLRHLRGQERSFDVAANIVRQSCWRPLRGPHVRGCWALDLILGKE